MPVYSQNGIYALLNHVLLDIKRFHGGQLVRRWCGVSGGDCSYTHCNVKANVTSILLGQHCLVTQERFYPLQESGAEIVNANRGFSAKEVPVILIPLQKR